MSNKKISALSSASTPLTGSEIVPINQSSVTDSVSVANLTAGRAISAASLALTTSPLPTTSGGTGLTSFTSNGVVYASSSSVLATGSALTFDGTNLYVGTTTQYDGGVITALNTTNNAVVGFRNSYASGGNPVIGYFRLTGQVGSTSNYILVGNTLTTGDTIYIYGNGNIVNKNNSYGTLSDAKLKTNVVLADTQWNDVKALGQVMKKFNFLTDPANSPLQLGWVAQDVQTISPGLVFSSPDRDDEGKTLETTSLGVNTSVAMLKAFKALSEALLRIEQLETQVTALQNKIGA